MESTRLNREEFAVCGVYELQKRSESIFGLLAYFKLDTIHEHILPHEETSSKVLKSVTNELLLSGIQKKPVTLLHRCPLLDKSVQSCKGMLLTSCEDDDGFLHSVYALDTNSFSFPEEGILLADGHHRFSALKHLHGVDTKLYSSLLGALFYSDTFCLLHLHLTLDSSYFSEEDFFAKISDHFLIRKIETGNENQEILIVQASSGLYGLEPKEKQTLIPSEILQDILLAECLGIYPFWDHPRILQLNYTHKFGSHEIENDLGAIHVYCKATTVATVFKRARKRSLFRHHSTHFYPYLFENLVPEALGLKEEVYSVTS